MDVVRVRRTPRIPRSVVGGSLVAAGAFGLAALAVPNLFARGDSGMATIARDGLVIDTVRRGTLEHSVTAAGVLVPDRVHVVATTADGVVTTLAVRAGARVSPNSVVAQLRNPELAVAVADTTAQLAAAEADVRSAREEASAARLDVDAALRSAGAEDARAASQARSDTQLHAQGLIGDLQYRSALITRAEDRDLVTIARSKVGVSDAEAAAKVAAAQARVDQLQAELAARRADLATLVVRAAAAGVVQNVAVDLGQRVTGGTELARVADDRDLKAVLQIAESDMRGVVPGLPARIISSDAGATLGHVARIAPAAQNGTVAVDVVLDRPLAGARADANVDGAIVIRRYANALSITRPVAASDDGRVTLYRLAGDGAHAYRTSVALGDGSVDRMRVIAGLAAGDRAIVSDTSTLDAPVVRIRP